MSRVPRYFQVAVLGVLNIFKGNLWCIELLLCQSLETCKRQCYNSCVWIFYDWQQDEESDHWQGYNSGQGGGCALSTRRMPACSLGGLLLQDVSMELRERLIRVKVFKWEVSWEKGPAFLPCVVLHLARSLASRTAGGPRFSNVQQIPCWLCGFVGVGASRPPFS